MEDLLFNPGFYTKVRLNQKGTIIGADQLTAKDLPQHTHDLKEIKGDLKEKIIEVLSTFFVNTENSAVEFSFDPLTTTVTADVRIDATTVQKNEYGELASKGGEIVYNPDNSTPSVTSQDIKKEIYEVLATAFANNNTLLFNWDNDTHTFETDIKIDGLTVSKNINGELQAITGGEVYPDSLGCATHTHTVSQILDFEEAVKALLDKYAASTIDIDTLQYLIDGETIIINEQGQLASVSTVVGKHTHVLKDITDYVAPEPAVKQMLTDLGALAIYDSGVIDFTELNIGYSILALSQYLKDVVNKNITNLNNKINQLSSATNEAGVSLLTPHRASIKNILWDKNNNCYREVYYTKQLQLTLDFLPKQTGEIELYVNNELKDSADISKLNATGVSVNAFKVEKSYFKNFNIVHVLKIDVRDFLQGEGLYTFKLRYVTDVAEDFSQTISIYATPYKSLEYNIEDVTNTHTILTTKYYPPVQLYKYKVSIKDYRNYRFINTVAGFKNGVLYKYSDSDVTISVPNLFEETLLSLEFPFQKEESTSTLCSYITEIQNAAVINDTIVSAGGPYMVLFTIPNTEHCNAIKIWNGPTKGCSIYKQQDDWARDVNFAIWPHVSGLIKMNAPYTLLWLSAYDPGTENIKLRLEYDKPLSLKTLQIEACSI